jgi:hypothetical protein
MSRSAPAPAPEDLFEAIATLLEPSRREYFYQRMLYFKHLRPEDELLRLVEAIGFLALLIREAPHAVAREREQMAQLLETSLATIQAVGQAGQAYQRQLDDRLTRLPTDLTEGISPEAIARVLVESLHQQFVQSGLPATADALTALSQQLIEATGHLQRAAGQLSACTGIAEQARGAIDQVRTSVAKATDTAHWAVAELRHQVRVEGLRAVSWLCGAAWLLGILGGITFERWRGAGVPVLPQAIAVPTPMAEPSSSTESNRKKATPATPATARDRRRTAPAPRGHDADPRDGTVMEQGSNSDGTAKRPGDAKPKA